MAFDQDPAAAAPFPTMGDPYGAGTRRVGPMASDPDVAAPIPVLIAVDPHPSRVRGTTIVLDDGRGRRNADDDLRHCNRRSETQSEKHCQCNLFHRNLNLHGYGRARNRGASSWRLIITTHRLGIRCALLKKWGRWISPGMRGQSGRSIGDSGGFPGREDVAHALNLGSYAAQLFFKALVAAVHVIDAVYDGLALGDQRSQHE